MRRSSKLLSRLSSSIVRRPLPWIVALAFGYKLLSLALIAGNLQAYGLERMGWDSPTYYEPAMAMARSFTFHSEVRTPGYPAFLALIYALTRDPNPISNFNLLAIFLAQSALLSLGCVPIYHAIRHLTSNGRLPAAGALVWAIHNSARYYADMVLTEALTAFLFCVLVYALARLIVENRAVWHAAAGALMFVLALVRPSVSLLALPVAAGSLVNAYLIRRERGWRPLMPIAGLLLLLPLSCMPLWAWRNEVVEGQRYYCRLSAFGVYAFGVAIPAGVSEGKDADAVHAAAWHEFFRLLPRMSPQEMDRMYRRRTLAAIEAHPAPIALYLLKSAAYLWEPTMNKPRGRYQYRDTLRPGFWKRLAPGQRAVYAFYTANSALEFLLLMGMTGLIAARCLPGRFPADPARRGFMVMFVIVVLYWIPVHSMSARYAAARFLFPLVPVIIVAAAVALDGWRAGRATEEMKAVEGSL